MSDKTQKEINLLQAKKDVLFARIQRVYDNALNINEPKQKEYFRTRVRSLETSVEEFNQLVDRIAHLNAELDPPQPSKYDELTIVDDMKCIILSVVDELEKTETKPIVSSNILNQQSPQNSVLRLARLDLPGFSGNPSEWPIFYHSFLHVHNHKELSPSDKLRYLISKLSKDALALISGFQPTEDNYNLIWDTLVRKYQDTRTIASYYLKQILKFKPLEKESAKGLDEFIQQVSCSVDALKNLNIPDLTDYVFLHLALSKLDSNTIRAFEMEERTKDLPDFKSLITFVKDQSKMLHRSIKDENIVKKDNSKNIKPKYKSFAISNVTNTDNYQSNKKYCHIHKLPGHTLNQCVKFKRFPIEERKSVVQEHKLCSLCLKPGHIAVNCTSNFKCYICSEKHNTLLHMSTRDVESLNKKDISYKTDKPSSEPPKDVTVHCYTNHHNKQETVLLSTVLICMLDNLGKPHIVRGLLDTASQSDFITKHLVQTLGLPVRKTKAAISGIGAIHTQIEHQTTVEFSSRYDKSDTFKIDPFIIDSITEHLPAHEVLSEYLSEFKALPLADGEYNNLQRIDVLLGANLFPILLGSEKRVSTIYNLVAVQTKLGYIILGKIPSSSEVPFSVNVALSDIEHDSELNNTVQQFWELEKIPEVTAQDPPLNKESEECEELFEKTTKRLSTGRYSVALPFRDSISKLGSSLDVSKKRFFLLEKRLNENITLRKEYNEIIEDYLKQGHMSLIGSPSDSYYLPHFPVVRLDRLSTKVRIVFDASQKSSTGLSLNDILYTGPKLQTDLTAILLGFRLFSVAVTADIKQMYRQIEVHPEFRNVQKILWRFSPEEALKAWTLNTVTFGVRPAPFLALRVIKHLVNENKIKFPLAAQVCARDIFVDDLVTSLDNIQNAQQLYAEISALFLDGQFSLTKWSSNNSELLQVIPEPLQCPKDMEFNEDHTVKVLGLKWTATEDSFSFTVQPPTIPGSKRTILSTLARIFDPLGFLSPVTIGIKLLVQKLWKLKLDWDDPLPFSIKHEWETMSAQLAELESLNIPRHLEITSSSVVDLIGFCDASALGYGAVIYSRVENTGMVPQVHMMCARSKIAPMKKLTIPQLELCAAVLVTKLMSFVQSTLQNRIHVRSTYVFSDSEVVLYWIINPSNKWKIFVTNRVNTIHQCLPQNKWAHVAGKENPADMISRGIPPKKLIDNKLWFKGPEWLVSDPLMWNIFGSDRPSEEVLNTYMLVVPNQSSQSHPWNRLLDRVSKYKRLIHIIIYVNHFLKRTVQSCPIINAKNIEQAELQLIKHVQNSHFQEDIKKLLAHQSCSIKLQKLNPFIVEDVLRVGGRLCNADITYNHKYPILLPKDHKYTTLLVEHIHTSNMHAGPHLVLSLLRKRFWIVDGKRVVRNILKKCNYCFKFQPKHSVQLMGNLPRARVTQAKPFVDTGVDFAGPFQITLNRYRGSRTQKAYICLFICMTVKAVHLELVSDLSTPMFLAALKRFIARRGPCSNIYSDCGTNFQGASNELNKLYQLVTSKDFNDTLGKELSHIKINWHFIPPMSPHMGGLWESNVKSMKTHLYKAIGDHVLTYEELNTVLVQIEALMNSRPLTDLSSDPSDPYPITPGHFLLQENLTDIVSEPLEQCPINRLSKYQLLNYVVQKFWDRWHLEYLSGLQTRHKWYENKKNVEVGTLVLLKNEHLPPMNWPMGIIDEVHLGSDGQVRVVTVRTHKNKYKRSIVNIHPLPTQ